MTLFIIIIEIIEKIPRDADKEYFNIHQYMELIHFIHAICKTYMFYKDVCWTNLCAMEIILLFVTANRRNISNNFKYKFIIETIDTSSKISS